MKTLSVREVASALGLTKRAVMYRLENGKLKGTRITNNYGQEEWRVYPNKEIMQAVDAKTSSPAGEAALNFEPEEADVVDAETSANERAAEQAPAREGGQDLWRAMAEETLRGLAEELVRPLAETIREQQELLAEKDKIIAEKDQQLRLLPDFQRQAEEEHKAAELNALEAEALKKQIAAMQAQQEEELSASRKVEELEKAMEQLRAEDAAKLEQLKAELQQLRTPWWKKMFKSV